MLDDLGVMVAMGVHALRSEKDVRAFYRSQGSSERISWASTHATASAGTRTALPHPLVTETTPPHQLGSEATPLLPHQSAPQLRMPSAERVPIPRHFTDYDGFREALLPSRDRLLKFCLPWVSKPKIWLSVGCGTARDIEYVVGEASGIRHLTV